ASERPAAEEVRLTLAMEPLAAVAIELGESDESEPEAKTSNVLVEPAWLEPVRLRAEEELMKTSLAAWAVRLVAETLKRPVTAPVGLALEPPMDAFVEVRLSWLAVMMPVALLLTMSS